MPTNVYGQDIGAAVENWTPRQPPSSAPMQGRLCRLEHLDPERHADALYAAYAAAPDGRDWTYMAVERFADRAAYQTFITAQAASTDPLHYAILDRAGERPLGTASLMRIDPANGVIEVGHIAFAPDLQRTPAGSEALYLIMCRVFDELGYRRLEWKCDALNAPSRRAALRYGFVFEGVFRQALVTKGRNRDTAWFSIIDRDWPAARKAFETWLSPSNFDENGRQRRTLASCRPARAGGVLPQRRTRSDRSD